MFKIKVKLVIKFRYFILRKSIKLISNISNLEITLKSIQDKAIIYVFSLEIYKAITISRIYKKELKEKKNYITEYILILFINKSNKKAYINLYLDLKKSFIIKDKLYN